MLKYKTVCDLIYSSFSAPGHLWVTGLEERTAQLVARRLIQQRVQVEV